MYGAVLCWLAFRNKFYPKAYLIGIVIYSVYAIGLFFWKRRSIGLDELNINAEDIAATMKAEKPWIEETREFFGLVILIVVLAIDYFYAKKRAHR